jgi:hypothetical protein
MCKHPFSNSMEHNPPREMDILSDRQEIPCFLWTPKVNLDNDLYFTTTDFLARSQREVAKMSLFVSPCLSVCM